MEQFNRAYVGFYWTLPVRRIGFRALPKDVDAAAKRSRTVRYQRDFVRHWVKGENGRLVHEAIFVEVDPDRASDAIESALDKALAICRDKQATLVYVDFGHLHGWRKHAPMEAWLNAHAEESAYVSLDAVPFAGFDPYRHFERWRARDAIWRANKGRRIEVARIRATQVRAEGASFQKVAETLNADGLVTVTGRPWTRETIRKLLGHSNM